MKTKLEDVIIIDIPKIVDPKGRGKLSVIEKDIIPFSVKEFSIFMMYQVMPGGMLTKIYFSL